jgi:uncharacterized membrane protein YagU involved in acid resistance
MDSRFTKSLKGGLIATAVMTIVMLMAPLMGMPKMPIGNMLANFMHIPVALGWVAHFMIGVVLAAGYVLLFQKAIRARSIAKGALYSLIPFFMAQLIVMPMMGAGLFSANTPAPLLMVMGSLIGHLVYGAVLGFVAQDAPAAVTA